MGNTAGNFFAGMGNGVLGLFGIRDAVDPLAKQKQALSNLKDSTQQYLNAGTLIALKNGTQIQQDLYQLLNDKQKELQTFVDYNNEIIWESVEENNLFIVLLFIVLLIVVFFTLF